MNKKSFLVILGISILVNYTVMVIDAFLRGSFLAGDAGLPLRFDYSSFLGGGSINYTNLFLDIAFWFIVIWIIWKFILKKR